MGLPFANKHQMQFPSFSHSLRYNDMWRKIEDRGWFFKEQRLEVLEQRWKRGGKLRAIYLNGFS